MKNIYKILFCFFLIALIFRLIIIFQPAESLVSFNGDDMYYYLEIAQNIILKNSVSFDGIHPTNGFHPIYLLLLLPIVKLTLNNQLLTVHLSLVLLALFNIATGFFVYKIINQLTKNSLAGIIGMFIWLFNPWSIFIPLMGVEVAISAFFISVTIYFYLKNREKGFTIAGIILIGLFAGLSILSRSDSIFLIFGITIDFFYFSIFKNYFFKTNHLDKKTTRTKYKFEKNKILRPIGLYILLGLTVLIIMLPWFVWSKTNFGLWMQGSGMAIIYNVKVNLTLSQFVNSAAFSFAYSCFKLVNYFITLPVIFFIIGLIFGSIGKKQDKINNSNSGLTYFLLILSAIIIIASSFVKEAVHYPQGLHSVMILSIMGLICLITGLLLGIKTKIFRVGKEFFENQIIIIATFMLVFGFYSIYFWHHQPWYYLSILLFMTLFIGALSSNYLNWLKKIRISVIKGVIILLIVLAIIFLIRYIRMYNEQIAPWQTDMYRSAIYMKENLKPTDTIGSLNAGIYGYYSGLTIVNLDGVVNYDVIKEKKMGVTLIEYMKKNNITYLIEYPCFVKSMESDLEIVKEIGYTKDPFCDNSGPILYRVKR